MGLLRFCSIRRRCFEFDCCGLQVSRGLMAGTGPELRFRKHKENRDCLSGGLREIGLLAILNGCCEERRTGRVPVPLEAMRGAVDERDF